MGERYVVKKRKNNRKIFLVIFILIIIAIGVYVILNSRHNNNDSSAENLGTMTAENEVKEEEETTTSLSLIMVGDNLVHSSIYKEANRNADYKGYDFKPMLTYIKEKVEGYDLAYYNQETIVGGTEIGLSDYPTFNSPYETADAMIDAGFNLVSTASNHTLDRGEQAVINSRKYWDKQEDVLAVGSYTSFEERDDIPIREKNGITYAMLNYTYGTNGIPVPEGKEYLVNVWPTDLYINDPERDTEYQAYKGKVKEDIAKVRDKVDVLIVAMHCGIEYTTEPSAYQKDEAQFLADQGVDIVIGTHPHVLEPVEWIDDTIVFYSLGNFISAQYQDENYNKTVGLMSSLNITKTTKGDETSIKIDNIKNELIYTYYNQATWSNFKVIPFSDSDIAKYLPGYKNVYERYKKVVQLYDEDMYVVPVYQKN